MHLAKNICIIFIIICCSLMCTAAAVEKKNFTVEDVFKIKGVSDAELSPDGKWIVYAVSIPDLAENKTSSSIWVYSTETGTTRQMTFSKERNTRPKWSPDSKSIAFVSTRAGTSQIFLLPVDGGEAKKITSITTGAGEHQWSPDGKYIYFTSSVYPECQSKPFKEADACNKTKDEQKQNSKMKARLITHLLYRHVMSWDEGKRSHIFMVPVQEGEPKDLTLVEYDVPPYGIFSSDNISISPDGKEIAFTMNTDKDAALSTNSNIYIKTIPDGTPTAITDNPGADIVPRYSPDGNYIAYRSQAQYGNEADKWNLMLYNRNTKKITNLTEKYEYWVNDIFWASDSKSVYIISSVKGNMPLLAVNITTKEITRIVDGSFWISNGTVSSDNHYIAFLQRDVSNPTEVFLFDSRNGKKTQISNHTNEMKDAINFAGAEEHWVSSVDNNKIHTLIVKPHDFQKNRKYGMVLMIHGGPQQMFGNAFRPEYQLLSSAGYVVVLPNPRGSFGYGQKFVDEISQDWGGKCYNDIMRVVDYVISLGYVDEKRMCAFGSSFGGYMVDWIEGHTDRFACLISHAGVYNLQSFHGTTEELWFAEWEYGGPPWKNPKLYEQMSPHTYAKYFKTPMLLTHGEMDFRVPISEGQQLFTALQRNNVPSKFLLFPDEGHGIQKLQNREFWYKTILDWLKEYLK